jgi:hypothetical protein
MERKVEEIFEYNGEWYQCVEGIGCYKCAFYDKNICIANNPHCTCRSDKKNVIFKKLEKVGEPEIINGKKVQSIVTGYVGCAFCIFKKGGACLSGGTCKNRGTRIYVEIKQNKEDMEEKKLNLKPFDLEAAKAGKPVCTRDGRKARIICFDAKRKDGKNIMALIPSKEYPGFEDLVAYPNNGNYHGGHENDGDLMMLPEKKEGWVNIYNRNRPRTSSENCYIMTGVSVFETKEGAISYIDKDKEYIDTVKIEWEE